MKTDLFQSCGHFWVFQICWHIECSTFTASSFRIWNSSTGIPSPPLALFVVMLYKAIWSHIPGCLALGEWSHHCDYLGREDHFCTVYSCHLFFISSASVRSIQFLSFIAKQSWTKSKWKSSLCRFIAHHCQPASPQGGLMLSELDLIVYFAVPKGRNTHQMPSLFALL